MSIARAIRRIPKTFGYFVVGVLLIVGAALFTETRRKETDASPTELIKLSESEIRDALVGNLLTVDHRSHPGFGEYFLPDGTYVLSANMRVIVTWIGKWRIDNSQICTHIPPRSRDPGREEICRDVWRQKLSGKIAMFDPLAFIEGALMFSSSPINEDQVPPLARSN